MAVLKPTQPSPEAGVKKDMEAVVALERDAQLMLRVREGDDTSFGLLLERHRGPVVHFLYRMVPKPSGIGGAGSGSFPAGLPEPGDVRADCEVHYVVVPHRHPCRSEFDTRREKEEGLFEPG